MSEPKRGNEKKFSLYPMSFEDALKKVLQAKPPAEAQEKKAASKRRRTPRTPKAN